jgi:hypothetical protein
VSYPHEKLAPAADKPCDLAAGAVALALQRPRPMRPTPTLDDAEPAPSAVTSPTGSEPLDELRQCSQAFLRVLVAGSSRPTLGGWRLVFEELARAHAAAQHALFGDGLRGAAERTPERLGVAAWIAMRGVLPDEGEPALAVAVGLARDLVTRCEDLLEHELPRPIARRLVAFAEGARTACLQLAQPARGR